jgi:hypothetical protein
MHGFAPDENLRLRVRVELTDGSGRRVAETDDSRELPGILDRHGFETAERHIIDFVEREVMSAVRGLVKAHIVRHGRRYACEEKRGEQPVKYDAELFEELTEMLLRGRSKSGD